MCSRLVRPHLHTVEVAGSNPAAPTSIRTLRRFVPADGASWDSRIAAASAGRPGQPGRRRTRGDVLEAAVRFGAELDASRAGNLKIGREAFEGGIEQRTLFEVAADKAIGDRDHLGGPREA